MSKFLCFPILLFIIGCRAESVTTLPECVKKVEICNGIDDDCDGDVDELIEVCTGLCGGGIKTCKGGVWSECETRKPTQEECNGKDDDCDGIVDEIADIGINPCYPGNTAELSHGECRFGVNRCIRGVWSCQGYITAKSETCNGKDDDCDGQIDEDSFGGLDLVFAIDYSGSMSDKIQNLQSVTTAWANTFAGRSDIKMALVGIPLSETHATPITVATNLTSPSIFASDLSRRTEALGSGDEPSLDVIRLISDASNPLRIMWSPNSRRALVIYTDEAPQSYIQPIISQQQAQSIANDAALRVFVFTSDNMWNIGNVRPFSSNTDLTSDLNDIIRQGGCR